MSTLTSPELKRRALEAGLLTYADVADLLQVSEKSVYRLGDAVPGRVSVGRSVRFVRAEVVRWIGSGCPGSDTRPPAAD